MRMRLVVGDGYAAADTRAYASRVHNVARLLGVLPMSSDQKRWTMEESLKCGHVCSVCRVEQMAAGGCMRQTTRQRCCRYRSHAILSKRRTHICTYHLREYTATLDADLFMCAWPILSFWIAQNYEAAEATAEAVAEATRAAAEAEDAEVSSYDSIPPALVSSSASSASSASSESSASSTSNASVDFEFAFGSGWNDNVG